MSSSSSFGRLPHKIVKICEAEGGENRLRCRLSFVAPFNSLRKADTLDRHCAHINTDVRHCLPAKAILTDFSSIFREDFLDMNVNCVNAHDMAVKLCNEEWREFNMNWQIACGSEWMAVRLKELWSQLRDVTLPRLRFKTISGVYLRKPKWERAFSKCTTTACYDNRLLCLLCTQSMSLSVIEVSSRRTFCCYSLLTDEVSWMDGGIFPAWNVMTKPCKIPVYFI